MIARFIKLILLTTVISLVLALFSAGILLSSESGSRWLIYSVIDKTGLPLTIERSEGRLLDDIRLFGIRYQDKSGQIIKLEQLEMSWKPVTLLRAHVAIDSLKMTGLSITTGKSGSDKKINELDLPALPVSLTIKRLHVEKVQLLIEDETHAINRIQGDLKITRNRLRINLEEAISGTDRVYGTATLARKERIELELELHWAGLFREKPAQAYVRVSGTQQELRFNYEFTGVLNANGNGKLYLSAQPIAFNGQSQITGELPEQVAAYASLASPLSLTINGTTEGFTASARTTLESTAGEPFDLDIESRGTLAAGPMQTLQVSTQWQTIPVTPNPLLTIKADTDITISEGLLTIKHVMTSPYAMQITGDVDFNDEVAVDLQMSWQEVQVPIKSGEPLTSGPGTLQVKGALIDLDISMQSQLLAQPVGAAEITITANWSPPLLTFHQMTVNTLEGEFNGKGKLSVNEVITGQFELAAQDINLAAINTELVSSLDARSMIQFSLHEQQVISGRLEVPSVSGEWRGYPLKGSASASLEEQVINIEDLQLTSGGNSINLQLSLNDTLKGTATVSLNDMSVLAPGLSGMFNSRMVIAGTVRAPSLNSEIQGEDIQYQDLRIKRLGGTTNLDLAPGKHSLFDLTANRLQYADKQLDELILKGQGLTELHYLAITASGEDLQLSARLDGGLNDNREWQATLTQLDIDTPLSGPWTLTGSAPLNWDQTAERFNAGKTCLSNNDAVLCLQGSAAQREEYAVSMDINKLPLNLTQPWLPETLSLEGTVTGNVNLSRTGKHWQSRASLSGSNTIISIGHENDREVLSVPEASIMSEVTEDKSTWNIRLASPGNFNVNMDGIIQAEEERLITSHLDLNLLRIDWLDAIDPALTGSKGQFKAEARLAGSLERPRVEGEYRLLNGQLVIQPLGLRLDQISGVLRPGKEQETIQVDAMLGSNGKMLELKGTASLLPEKGYPYDFKLKGEDFPLVRTAEVTLDASPDLSFYGSSDLHYIRGSVLIPKLKMLIVTLPKDTVTVSPDTRIIQQDGSGAMTNESEVRVEFIREHMDIEILFTLGESVQIQGFGLDTRVAGEVNVVKPVGIYLPRAEGLLTLSEGSYRAYGQNLIIEDGQVQFAGPIDNPGINVRAYRPKLEVKPGVWVKGNIRQPRVTLYSEPSLPDADILSYLITGRPIARVSSNEDANLLSKAALALGTRESVLLASQIQNMFGLDELTVDTGETLESSSIIAGKQISPQLNLRSAYNPFDQLWTFFLTYQLTKHWSIQTESGDTQGGDIIYSVESNRITDLIKKIWSPEQ